MIHLNRFRIGNEIYDHFICTETDATFLKDRLGKVLFKVNSDAYMYNGAGDYVGKFRTDENHLWEFHSSDETIFTTGNKSLIKAEMKVFKNLLGEI
ncbi:MAG TPA: hypothetical protein VFM18_14995 [Methanosarcina sp.]|nr:hypothetical protein [Methanosarcina sp.]